MAGSTTNVSSGARTQKSARFPAVIAPHDFDGDGAFQPHLRAFVNGAHTALSQQTMHLVEPYGEERAQLLRQRYLRLAAPRAEDTAGSDGCGESALDVTEFRIRRLHGLNHQTARTKPLRTVRRTADSSSTRGPRRCVRPPVRRDEHVLVVDTPPVTQTHLVFTLYPEEGQSEHGMGVQGLLQPKQPLGSAIVVVKRTTWWTNQRAKRKTR